MQETQVASPEFWVLTADSRNARLLSGYRTQHGRLHMDEHAALEEEWDEYQHGRPSPRSGKYGHTYASAGHENEERAQRFARTVAHWLEHEMQNLGIPHLHAFSARRFLGYLREILPHRLLDRLEDHPLELTHLSPAELAGHAAVQRLGPERKEIPRLDRKKAVRTMTRDKDTAIQLAYEHATVRNAINDILGEIDRLRGESGPEHHVGRLSGMLLMFRHHLERHFRLEEQNGYLSEGLELDSDRQRDVEALLQQHRAFERQLGALLEGVEQVERGRACLPDAFTDELRSFLTELVHHESAENELVQKLVIRTAGSGG